MAWPHGVADQIVSKGSGRRDRSVFRRRLIDNTTSLSTISDAGNCYGDQHSMVDHESSEANEEARHDDNDCCSQDKTDDSRQYTYSATSIIRHFRLPLITRPDRVKRRRHPPNSVKTPRECIPIHFSPSPLTTSISLQLTRGTVLSPRPCAPQKRPFSASRRAERRSTMAFSRG